ncbi:MAG: phosphotransferase family protein [Myxococcota bacterium]
MGEDLTALAKRIEAHVGAATGAPAAVSTIARLPGGACQELFRVDLATAGFEGRVVLRSDAPRSLPGSIDRRQEFRVIEAALAAGVRTPRVQWLTEGLVRDGAHAYFMDWADGEAIGRRVVRNAELEAARAKLPAELGAELARIHSITPARAPQLFPSVVADAAADRIRFARAMIDRLREPHPALEFALRWLSSHAPATREVVLLHGDFRTGNFMVTPLGLAAVLDWEFSHWGAPAEDLAWISLRDWRFGRLDRPVGGFGAREPFYDAYERESGRRVDRRDVRWWEIMGNVWWAAGCVCQGERYLSGEESDLELVAISRRSAEMEFEALRLIEAGYGGA